MSVSRRIGVLYGKLGLSTDPKLIELRTAGAKTASEGVKREWIGDLVRCSLGLKAVDTELPFFEAIGTSDPTFDVHPEDKEASLLAGAILAFVIEEGESLSGNIALTLTTASFGGLRVPPVDKLLLQSAYDELARQQGNSNDYPKERTYTKQPKAVTDAVQTLQQTHYQNCSTSAAAAVQELGKYCEANALAAARSDNLILSYVKRLEEEMRVYWWVTGGWCAAMGVPYRNLSLCEAAIFSGKELAEKHGGSLGVFAAPALLDIIISRSRNPEFEDIVLADAAASTNKEWRLEAFLEASKGAFADLTPVSTALGLAAASDDNADWQPRFLRLTGIDVSTKLNPNDLALQIYREKCLLRTLEE